MLLLGCEEHSIHLKHVAQGSSSHEQFGTAFSAQLSKAQLPAIAVAACNLEACKCSTGHPGY